MAKNEAEKWLLMIPVYNEEMDEAHVLECTVGPCSERDFQALIDDLHHYTWEEEDERLLLRLVKEADISELPFELPEVDENTKTPLSDAGLRPGFLQLTSASSLGRCRADIADPVAFLSANQKSVTKPTADPQQTGQARGALVGGMMEVTPANQPMEQTVTKMPA